MFVQRQTTHVHKKHGSRMSCIHLLKVQPGADPPSAVIADTPERTLGTYVGGSCQVLQGDIAFGK
jgi:hypothetical protein